MRLSLLKSIALALVPGLLFSCTKLSSPITGGPWPDSSMRRVGTPDLGYEKVLICYLEGYNNLSSDIVRNINELCSGEIPFKHDKQALLIYAHNSLTDRDYVNPTEPVLIKAYQLYGAPVLDTIARFSSQAPGLTSSNMRQVLTYIRNNFHSRSYGMLFSSHATGWIPASYPIDSEGSSWLSADGDEPSASAQSIGAEYVGNPRTEYMLDVADFAAAIPVHLDYLILDCCLMGGIECCYDLAGCSDYIVASPAEVLSYGFDYHNMASRLFSGDEPDLEGLCADYFEKCKRSATVALYKSSEIGAVADACKKIVSYCGDKVFEIDPDDVEDYNYSFSYNYDMRDIFDKMGAKEEDLASLDSALEKFILFKMGSDYLFDSDLDPERFSGVSMYLPSTSWPKLNALYKNTGWSAYTGYLQ